MGRALWGNRSDVLRRVRDPKALVAAFAKRGIRAPRVIDAEEAVSLPRAGERWMLKPRVSGGGHGVRVWSPGEPVPPGHYLQEFVEGTSGSVIFVAAGGRGVVLGITRQLVGDRAFGSSGFRYCGNILLEPDDVVPHAVALVDAVAAEFSLVGVGSIDVIASEHGLQPVEVNPRWSASMELVERARGISMFAIHADACVKGELPATVVNRSLEPPAIHGKAIVFARQDVVIGDTSAMARRSECARRAARWRADRGRPADLHCASQPAQTMTAATRNLSTRGLAHVYRLLLPEIDSRSRMTSSGFSSLG